MQKAESLRKYLQCHPIQSYWPEKIKKSDCHLILVTHNATRARAWKIFKRNLFHPNANTLRLFAEWHEGSALKFCPKVFGSHLLQENILFFLEPGHYLKFWRQALENVWISSRRKYQMCKKISLFLECGHYFKFWRHALESVWISSPGENIKCARKYPVSPPCSCTEALLRRLKQSNYLLFFNTSLTKHITTKRISAFGKIVLHIFNIMFGNVFGMVLYLWDQSKYLFLLHTSITKHIRGCS